MDRALIDTDILSYYLKGDAEIKGNLRRYLEVFNEVDINIISHNESHFMRLTEISDLRVANWKTGWTDEQMI